jgi:hypothetical protein
MPAYGTECRGREPSPYAPQPPGNSHRTRHLQETLLVLSHLRDDCLDDFPDAIVLQRLPESLRSLTESVFVKVEHRDGEWSELALGCGCERDVDDRARSSRLTSRSARRGGALGMGFGTRELAEPASRFPTFVAAIASATQGRMVPSPGGVLILGAGGEVVGAVGISGDTGDNDEVCAVAGITSSRIIRRHCAAPVNVGAQWGPSGWAAPYLS